jgi:hypothetical protein
LPALQQLSREELMRHQELKGHPVFRIGFECLPQQSFRGKPGGDSVPVARKWWIGGRGPWSRAILEPSLSLSTGCDDVSSQHAVRRAAA